MNKQDACNRPLILLGAGGHARVLQDLIQLTGQKILGVCDPQLARLGQNTWRGLTVLGGDEALNAMDPATVGLVNGLGQMVGDQKRRALHQSLRSKGFIFPTLIHPFACVASSASLADGVQVMAGAVVQPDSRIDSDVIINTRASVDHDCAIGPHVHIAPGAILCGGVQVGAGVFIGAGAVVIQGIHVGAGAIVGAGATLTRNLADGLTFQCALGRVTPHSH